MGRQMTFGTDKFGAPEGTYLAKFVGVTDREARAGMVGRDGKPLGPGLEWQFEILQDPDHGGEYVGRLVSRTTGQEPTKGNACGRIIKGLSGGKVTDGTVDVDQFAGRTYQVQIELNSEGTGTRVGSVQTALGLAQQPAAAPVPATGAPAGVRSRVPPPPPDDDDEAPAVAASEAFADLNWFVRWPKGATQEMKTSAVEKLIASGEVKADALKVCKVGGSEWVTAKAAGFFDGESY
jgi:hypothetical protein